MVHHPVAWARYVWLRELRHREVTFRQNPRFIDWAPMYRSARAGLIRLTGATGSELDAHYAELAPLHAELRRELDPLPVAGAMMQAPLLYLIVRASRPQRLVETGVSSGYSARFLLEALERNGAGELTSIGIQAFGARPETTTALGGKGVGWLVPAALRERWHLRVGPSVSELPAALSELGAIDLFVHDSLHDYPTMSREYREAWPILAPGGWLCSHDIHNNQAWPDFLREHDLADDAEFDHDLGVVRKRALG